MADSTDQPSRSRDLNKLLLYSGHLVASGPELTQRNDLQEYTRVLVVGAGGLGCELLSLRTWHCLVSLRLEDVGKPKAEVAAKRVMERVSGVNIVPHFGRIEDKELNFYREFSIIVLGLDSIEARSYINAVACGFLGLHTKVSEFVKVKTLVCGPAWHSHRAGYFSYYEKVNYLKMTPSYSYPKKALHTMERMCTCRHLGGA